MRRCVCAAGLCLAGLGLLAPGLTQARAADTEVREFKIMVDGKDSGTYQMKIERQDDGTEILSAESNVRVKVVGISVYTYSYKGKEVWKNGRLQHFESSGKDDGKGFAISAEVDQNVLAVTANGQNSTVRADVWLTSFYRLPDPQCRNAAVPLLGCDSGKPMDAQLKYIGTELCTICGQPQNCEHYRVTNPVVHEVWYDIQERMVRHEWTSDGHRTVLEMTGVQH
jgi:hypothetical protein